MAILLTTAQIAASTEPVTLDDATRTYAVIRFRAQNDPTKVGAAARAAIELHRPTDIDGATYCESCRVVATAPTGDALWPCPTMRAMTAELDLSS